jgi:hypothetical protein
MPDFVQRFWERNDATVVTRLKLASLPRPLATSGTRSFAVSTVARAAAGNDPDLRHSWQMWNDAANTVGANSVAAPSGAEWSGDCRKVHLRARSRRVLVAASRARLGIPPIAGRPETGGAVPICLDQCTSTPSDIPLSNPIALTTTNSDHFS